MPRLTDEAREKLLDCFDSIASEDAPSLVEQMARNADEDQIPDAKLSLFEKYFPGLVDVLGNGYTPKRKQDRALLDVLGFEESKRKEVLNSIYSDILIELVELKEVMD